MKIKNFSFELEQRFLKIYSLYKQEETIADFLRNNKNIPECWVSSLRNYCKICKSTFSCEKCFNSKRYNFLSKEEKENKKQLKKQEKEKNKKCKYCGITENLAEITHKLNKYKMNICKSCLSEILSESKKNMHKNRSPKKSQAILNKIHKTRNKTLSTLSDEEKRQRWSGEFLSNYIKNENEIQKKSRITKMVNTVKNYSNEEKENKANKITKTWSKKSKEDIDIRSEKIFKTKIEKGTFNNFQVFGYDKNAQELFWFLHDNLNVKIIKYATINTRDISNPMNNEFKIRVKDISKTNIFRNLDCYIKLLNNIEINIEFDPKTHKKTIEADTIRELEILTKKPNIIILRVREQEYLQNKKEIKQEILDIIKNIENNNKFSYNSINNKYLPLYLTNI